MNRKIQTYGLLIVVAIMIIMSSCKRNNFDTNPDIKLIFSNDTVSFDTVFTTLHSSYRMLKVYNTSKSDIQISNVRLQNGSNSYYKINVDGTPGTSVNNIELKAKDSLYIFVRVTIDPNSTTTPFIVEDDLVFSTNGNTQTVKLFAYGQNANFFKAPPGKNFYTIGNGITPTDTTWTNNGLPFVIYGWLAVDSLSTLRIEEGCNIYFHNKSGILVYTDASLHVNGTLEHPVTFRNDRFEPFYKDLSGQWEGLWFYEGSVNNTINYATIQNGRLAIQTDMFSQKYPNASNLKVSNTIINNMEIGGLACNGSVVEGYNLLISACGSYAMALNAGEYNFKQVSIANYGAANITNRETTSLHISNSFITYNASLGGNVKMLMDTRVFFGNSIITGNKDEELSFDNDSQAKLEYQFDHCLLRTKTDISKNPNSYLDVIVSNKNPFKDPSKFNLSLKEDSEAIGKGVPMGITNDYLDHPLNNPPDLGALQYVSPNPDTTKR